MKPITKDIQGTLRQSLLNILEYEHSYHASLQNWLRSQKLDHLMKYLSIVGSTLSFICILPSFFISQPKALDLGLFFTLRLNLAVYLSSLLKDYFQLPRPKPPVVAMDLINYHKLEYGLPSTHAVLTIVMALLFNNWLQTTFLSGFNLYLMQISLVVFSILLIFSRVYLGMHSILDIVVGSLLGYLIHLSILPYNELILLYFKQTSLRWNILFSILFSYICLIILPPQKYGDCPCFKDSIRMMGAFCGIKLGCGMLFMFPQFQLVPVIGWWLLFRMLIGYILFAIIILCLEYLVKFLVSIYIKFNFEAILGWHVMSFKTGLNYPHFFLMAWSPVFFIPMVFHYLNI